MCVHIYGFFISKRHCLLNTFMHRFSTHEVFLLCDYLDTLNHCSILSFNSSECHSFWLHLFSTAEFRTSVSVVCISLRLSCFIL